MKSRRNSEFDSVLAGVTAENDMTAFSQWKNLYHIQFNRGTREGKIENFMYYKESWS
jgi:hypothetical protein